jgi:ADP-ribosyl-[dinitrogen reductase] hydrolase
MENKIKGALYGMAVGDALGVPVEFKTRESINQDLVIGMRSDGTHEQAAGTWSDDSSLAFCLAESIANGYDINDVAKNFVKWRNENFWTARGRVFDIGIATNAALCELMNGQNPIKAGGIGEHSNGNGSLMRILPLLFYIKDMPIEQRFEMIDDNSSITHGHIRSIFSCFIYLEFALELLNGKEKFEAFTSMQQKVNKYVVEYKVVSELELNKFHRLLCNPISNYIVKPIYEFEEVEINSSGYVLHTLEASIWCLLKTNSFNDAVLKAVNLGDDTDTTGCVTGGLAGLYYGYESIKPEWIGVLARKEDIEDLCKRMNVKLLSINLI